MNKSSIFNFILVLVILYFVITSISNSLEHQLEMKNVDYGKPVFCIIILGFLSMVFVNTVLFRPKFRVVKKYQIIQLLKSTNNNRNSTYKIYNKNGYSNSYSYSNSTNNHNTSFSSIKNNNNLKLVNIFNQDINSNILSIPIIDINQIVFKDFNLGEGSNASVKKAIFMGKEVAIKTGFKFDMFTINEIKCHMLLSGHKNIIDINGFFNCESSREPSFVLELMDMNLHDYLMSKKNSLGGQHSSIYRIINEIIDGLKYMHFNNFVHGDLHPGNILVKNNSSGEFCPTLIKLSDFGLTKYLPSDLLSDTSAIGCRLFMSPESVARGRAVYQKSDDIYSLGVMVWLLFNTVSYGSKCEIITKRFMNYGVSALEIDSIPQLEGLITKCLGPSHMRPTIEEFEVEFKREEAKFNAMIHWVHNKRRI